MKNPSSNTLFDGGTTNLAEISWVSPRRVRYRLDASFYAPRYLQLDAALDSFEASQIHSLENFLKSPRRVLYMGTQTYEPKNSPPNGVPFISGGDLDGA